MKYPWLVLVGLLLAGCAPDQTLDSLIPREALAVAVVESPVLVTQALGSRVTFPWSALDQGRPWAGAVLPAQPPALFFALALASRPRAWEDVEQWAEHQGGLLAVKMGSYAVLTSPGIPEPEILDRDRRFDLSRVRSGEPLSLYLDASNAWGQPEFAALLRPLAPALPWLEANLEGLHLGFSGKDGGLEVRAVAVWKPGSPGQRFFSGWPDGPDPGAWTGNLSGSGVALSLPSRVWSQVGTWLGDPALDRRWQAVAPLLGPRVAVVFGRGGSVGAVVETRDPQAIRQALKTLMASGELQRHFSSWALDPDTPLIYQDRPSPNGVRTSIRFGPQEYQVSYGSDRVVFAGTEAALLDGWERTLPAPWVGQAPENATALAEGDWDGLKARGALRVLGDGNLEIRTWVEAKELSNWEQRFPQAALRWLGGEGGWTRWEP